MAMEFTRSFDCKMYRGPAGSTANLLMKNVVDVTTAGSRNMIDRSLRGSNYKSIVPGRVEGGITFGMRWTKPADEDLVAIRSAWLAGTPIALAILDALIGEGGTGLDADFYITKFERSEPNDDGVDVSVEAMPSDALRDPTYKIA